MKMLESKVLFLFVVISARVTAAVLNERDGSCGENVSWKLEDGTLVIFGTGDMYDYFLDDEQEPPWFSDKDSIENVVIMSGVESIGIDSFYQCTRLTNVSISETVKSIKRYAFEQCTSLKSFFVPKTVESIGWGILEESGLSSIVVEDGHTRYSSIDGVLIDHQKHSLVQYPCGKGEIYTVPEGITTIDAHSFCGCNTLKAVYLPDSLTTLEGNAFSECSNLTQIVLPANVTQIGTKAFELCTSLVKIYYLGTNVIDTNNVFYLATQYKTICTAPGYPDEYFCHVAVKSGTEDCIFFQRMFNKCYIPSINGSTFIQQKRTVAIEWENNTNWCFEYLCDNETGFEVNKKQEAIEWEKNTNECAIYQCFNETGMDIQIKKSYEQWKMLEDQENHCYERVCNDSTWVIQKRKNATEWEDRTNACVKYSCINETGRDSTSMILCNDGPACYNHNGICNEMTELCEYEKVGSYNELIAQENECYEVVCDGNDWVVQERDEVTKWKAQTTNCVLYHCENNSGNVKIQLKTCEVGSESNDQNNNTLWIIVGVCVGAFVIVLVASIVLMVVFCGKRQSSKDDLFDGGGDDDDAKISVEVNGETLKLSLTKIIGKGSFGYVWLAQCENRTFAVKEMERSLEEKDEDYRKELSIMSRLQSEYVVHVYGSDLSSKSFYIIMEYVSLGALSTAINDYTFSAYMRCRFMLDVARGMEYLHSQGVIHRDLKPGNVLVSSLDPNSDVLCKITDFGESRQGLEDSHTLTMTRGIGSPYYMAPEMLRGDKKYTRAVDVYSFSIMCVELWNERIPYSDMQFDTAIAFAMYVMEGNRPSIREDCPQSLSKIISDCWAQETLARPSFEVVVKDLTSLTDEVERTMTPRNVQHVKSKRDKRKKGSNSDKSHHKSSDDDAVLTDGIPLDDM